MPNARANNYLHLHFLVFVAGFTAILGELISINAVALVWYRMLIAAILMLIYIKIFKVKTAVSLKVKFKLFAAGVIIALHWITFFEAINQSNVSITLAMFSTGAFFASFIEPLVFKRKIVWYEIMFGLVVVVGVFLITESQIQYFYGIILGITSALLSTLFAVINGKLIRQHDATIISFYEFISGVLFITIFILIFQGGYDVEFFSIPSLDWLYLFILASVCTAYAFIGSVKVMKYISPYTVVLTYNLEPIYGIILAVIAFPETEVMNTQFYYGVGLVLSTVLANGLIKNRKSLKKEIDIKNRTN